MKSLMEGAVRLVLLQFSFSNLKLIPNCIKQNGGVESVKEFVARKGEIRGEQCLEPVENVGCLTFLSDLLRVGYVLVDAFSKIREKDGRKYAAVRFTFAEASRVNCSEEFAVTRPVVEEALRQMFESAMWRVRAFLNHFFERGEPVDGQYALSVNLEARNPLIDAAGKPICQWQKDEHGERIGTSPVPIQPKLFLRMKRGNLVVESNT